VVEDFRGLLQEFIRGFGLLEGDRTPCGTPLPTSDAHALMCLLEIGDAGIQQAALVKRLGVDKSTASRIIARLGERGHVEPAPASGDARTRPVRLTKKGVRVANEIDVASVQRFARVLEQIPRRRRATVVAALRDIVTAVSVLHANEGEHARDVA
jgi:DNA-binding MarR family transcriptional regulator